MDMNEKNGQPSMEEILASIRRIIAEDPSEAAAGAEQGAKSGAQAAGPVDDSPEFELPSIFRSQSGEPQQKQTPRFNRLTDAIRGNQSETAPEGQSGAQSQSGLSSLHSSRSDGAPEASRPGDAQQTASSTPYVSPATFNLCRDIERKCQTGYGTVQGHTFCADGGFACAGSFSNAPAISRTGPCTRDSTCHDRHWSAADRASPACAAVWRCGSGRWRA